MTPIPIPRKGKYDFNAARLAYLNQEGSLRELAIRFHIPKRSLERRAVQESWHQHAQQIGGNVAAVAVNMTANQAMEIASKLSLPERSQKLKEKVLSQMEVDADFVSGAMPTSLETSQARQNILNTLTRTSEVVLLWGNENQRPIVNIDHLNSITIATPEQIAQAQSQPVIDLETNNTDTVNNPNEKENEHYEQ